MVRNIRLDHLFVCLSVRKVYCGKTADWIRDRMPFGVVSGMGPGIDALDGVHVPQWKGLFLEFLGICAPIRLNGQNDVLFAEKCIRLVCEKLTVFPYGQDIIGNVVSLAF